MTAPVSGNPEVVRRYREFPSPLVRDNLQGWRTGRLDKVWEGNFDLFPGLLDPASKSVPE
jgi:ATP-dependent Clp protease ATP-binding subunit ClpC